MRERAVYYCRVSTEEENQLASMARQKEEAQQAIRDNGWELVEGYVDEGRSGTTTRYRTEYRRMNEDMEADRFDILVVKSQDRLMRNTREWYLFLDRLLRYRKKLYFYLERRFYSSEDALLTGIKAILAEDYSRSLSRNINHAHKQRQKSGSNVVLTSCTWGYDKQNRQVVINEAEAKMIRLIFEWAAQDYGSRIIAGKLAEQGYRNRKGGRLAEQTVRRIIRNPLYKGTARMHTQHRDFETKQIEKIEREHWIYHDGAVPAIVSEELWEKANRLMDSRRQQECVWGRKRNLYSLSGKVRCGLCGSIYWRKTRQNVSGKKHVWSCSRFLEEGRKGCPNIHLPETEIESLAADVIKGCLSLSDDKKEDRLAQAAFAIGESMESQKSVWEELSEIRVYPSYLEIELTKQQTQRSLIRVEIKAVNSRTREYQIRL